MEKIMQVKN